MTPTKFPEAITTLAAPRGWDEAAHGKCGGLPVWSDGDRFVSCWRPSWRERFTILFGGPVWLTMVSRRHPAVSLHAIKHMFVPAGRVIVEDGSEIIARAGD